MLEEPAGGWPPFLAVAPEGEHVHLFLTPDSPRAGDSSLVSPVLGLQAHLASCPGMQV